MARRVVAIMAILSLGFVSLSFAGTDNGVKEGAKKVEGGVRAAGESAGEIGSKAAKAAEGAVRDTGKALERAWDNVSRGLKKAFK